jgi:hypothetical protein
MATLSNVLKAGLAIGLVVLLVLWLLQSGKNSENPTRGPENQLAPSSAPVSERASE